MIRILHEQVLIKQFLFFIIIISSQKHFQQQISIKNNLRKCYNFSHKQKVLQIQPQEKSVTSSTNRKSVRSCEPDKCFIRKCSHHPITGQVRYSNGGKLLSYGMAFKWCLNTAPVFECLGLLNYLDTSKVLCLDVSGNLALTELCYIDLNQPLRTVVEKEIPCHKVFDK